MKDHRLESKLGFEKIRKTISDRCMTDYAAQRVEEEEFSTDAQIIEQRLALTDEMRLILMFEENFPTTGYIDTLSFLDGLQKAGSCIDILSLGKLKTLTDTIRRLLHFFGGVKDGIYPKLKKLVSAINSFPEIQRRIETILDKYGDVKDSASDALMEIRNALRPYLPELMAGASLVGEIDFLIAKAQTALDFIAGMPVISTDGRLSLRKARHPLLEKALASEGKNMVPLTVSLDPRKRILLISGPNAGGKSVCLKTVGLLQYMFQWGMLIPTSETSELPIFDRIVVSIGDNQNIEDDLSTYSSFLADMRDMLSAADERTLVLIDEFGSGTEPAAGGAIAEAILSEIDRRGVYGVITTHYTNLKLYASGADTHVTNGAMLYDSSKIAPMFKLEIGLPGNSFAFELARKMRLPENIVKDAENRAGEEFVGIERNLRKIARNRRALDEKLQRVKNSDKALTGLTEKYTKELEDIKRQKEEILSAARQEAEEIVKGAGRQVEKTIKDIKEAQAEKDKTKAARLELQGFLGAIQEKKVTEKKNKDEYIDRKIAQLKKRKAKTDVQENKTDTKNAGPLKVGEKVRIKDSGMVGELAKISAKSATVIVGNISSTLSPSRIERISSNEFREASRKAFTAPCSKVDSSITERKLNFSPELDIRGERLSDALNIVTHYIDDAIMLNIGTVRIIHGKGTGVLREEIQKYLRTIPGITASDEDIRNGGAGVTVVKL